MCIVKLLDILKSHELGLENKQYRHVKNFVTRKLFPQDAWQQIVDCEKNEDKNLWSNDKRKIAIW